MWGRRVTGPDGRRWRIRRRWPLWRLRWRDLGGGDLSGGFSGGDDIFSLILIVILVILILPVLISLILFAVEFLALLLLLPLVFAWRIATGKAWNVQAKLLDAPRPRPRFRVRVPGWGASGDMIDQLAAEIATTGLPRSAAFVPPRREKPENATTGG